MEKIINMVMVNEEGYKEEDTNYECPCCGEKLKLYTGRSIEPVCWGDTLSMNHYAYFLCTACGLRGQEFDISTQKRYMEWDGKEFKNLKEPIIITPEEKVQLAYEDLSFKEEEK